MDRGPALYASRLLHKSLDILVPHQATFALLMVSAETRDAEQLGRSGGAVGEDLRQRV